MTPSRNVRTLAWTLGLGGAVGCTLTAGLTAALGVYSAHTLTYLTFIAAGLLGALVASRAPRNGVGWLMCAGSLTAILLYLPLDYAYAASAVERGSWPFAGLAFWLAAWTWVPLFCLFLPVLTVRFPDGAVPPRWRAVDWLAGAGTAVVAAGVALSPRDVMVFYLPLSQAQLALVSSSVQNPLGVSLPAVLAQALVGVGLALVLLAYAASVVSVVDRFRSARAEERLQLKWFAYAGVLLVAVLVVVGAASVILGVLPGGAVEIALHLSFFALPLAIAIAILRYRLYDIDLIINRTLVYGSLTAIVAALYAAVVAVGNRFFISASGQKSDAAYFVTAFVVVVAAYPIKDWLQHEVDRRIAHGNPSAVLGEFSADVEAVVSVLDVKRVAYRLVDQAVVAFGARGAALYLRSNDTSNPTYTRGHLNGEAVIEVPLHYENRQLGRLVLGSRHGDVTYSPHDRDLLQRSADLVSEALALAEHLGFRPPPDHGEERIRP